MCGNSAFSNTSLKTGIDRCASEVRLECRYDDPWRTPITNAPIRIEDSNGVLLPGTPKGPTTRGLIDFGLIDGHAAVPAYRSPLGTFPNIPAQRGAVRVALVADPAAQSEVDTLSAQIISQMGSFQSAMGKELLPWITQWNDQGILSICLLYTSPSPRD